MDKSGSVSNGLLFASRYSHESFKSAQVTRVVLGQWLPKRYRSPLRLPLRLVGRRIRQAVAMITAVLLVNRVGSVHNGCRGTWLVFFESDTCRMCLNESVAVNNGRMIFGH